MMSAMPQRKVQKVKKQKNHEDELNKNAMSFLRETFKNPEMLTNKDIHEYAYKVISKK